VEGVILLSGPIGVGKSSFANALVERFGAIKVGTRDYILQQTGCDNERRALQNAGDDLDRETGGAWVADCVQEAEAAGTAGPDALLLLDSARIEPQVRALRARFSIAASVKLRPHDFMPLPFCAPANDATRGSCFSSRSAGSRLMMG